MPNKKDVINVDGHPTTKRHLLSSKKEAYLKFLHQHPLYPFKYTTFRKSIPRHIKKTNLNQPRVCVCLRCFNFYERVRAVSHESVLQKMGSMNLRSVYKESVFDFDTEFPTLECIDGNRKNCKDMLLKRYNTLIRNKGEKKLRFAQWEQVKQKYTNSKRETVEKKVWLQVEHCTALKDIISELNKDIVEFKQHMFCNEYQYHQHQKMATNLPQDQAILYADFSQNYALASNDEIINVHYVTKQVTVHTVYLIRHAANSTPQKDSDELMN